MSIVDKAIGDAHQFFLALEGFDILAYDSVETLLRHEDAFISGCLVVDQQMPEMASIELVTALRRGACFIPSILITTWPSQGFCIRAIQAGCRLVLEKSLKASTLSDGIDAAIHETRSRAVEARLQFAPPDVQTL